MCLFCKIINKDIPAHIVYENDDVMAILDISQVTKGHTLVIPKIHVENFLECPDHVLHEVASVSRDLGEKIMNNLHAKGMNILSNAKEIAGQTIMHYHVHLIPRYDEQDGIKIQFRASDDPALEEIAAEVKK